MRSLPMLDDVRIASPCSANWNEMVGDDRVRFCGSCEKNVYNLSAMLAHEAEQLLAERMNGELCVRFYRADGTMMTQDCPVGAKKKRRKLLAMSVAGAGAMAAAAATALLHRERTMMGEPAFSQPPCHLADIGTSPNDGEGRHVMGDVEPAIMGSAAPPALTPPAPPPPAEVMMGRRSIAPALRDVKKKL